MLFCFQDPYNSQRTHRRLFPENPTASQMLPSDVRSHGQERASGGKGWLQLRI